MTTSNVPVCVPPIEITESIISATDVAENDYPVIVDSTAYSLEDRVISTFTHRIYECILAFTSGAPATAPNLDETHWVEVSATNRYKVFDTVNSSQTAQASSISYTLAIGEAVSTVGILNITNAITVRVRLIDATYGTVFDTTADVSEAPSASGWWQWFFGLRSAPIDTVFTNLPSYPAANLHIDITGGDDLAVGSILAGQAVPLGDGFQAGARVGIREYSKVQENQFGDTVLVQGAFAKRATFPVETPREEFDSVIAFLATMRATPCLWIGSDNRQSTFIYGFYEDYDGIISYTTHSELSIQLRGLT